MVKKKREKTNEKNERNAVEEKKAAIAHRCCERFDQPLRLTVSSRTDLHILKTYDRISASFALSSMANKLDAFEEVLAQPSPAP